MWRSLSPEVRRNFTIDSVSAIFVGLFAGMVYPFLAVIAVRNGGGSLETGMLAAAPFVGNILAVIWGRWSEGKRKIPIVFYALGCSRLLILFIAFITSSWAIVAIAIVHFIVASMATPAYVSLMGKVYPANIRASLMAYVRVLLGILQVAAIYAAGRLYDAGMYWGFALAALLGIIGISIFRQMSEPAEEPGEGNRQAGVSWSEMAHVLRDHTRFRWYLIGFFVFEFAFLLPTSVYPLYQVNDLGLSNTQIATISITWSVAWFLSYAVWGKVIDKTSPLVGLVGAAVLNSLVPLIYGLQPGFFLCAVAGIFGAFGASALDLAWITQVNRMGGSRASTFSGIHLTLVGFRGLITPLIGAGLYQWWGGSTLFFVSGAILLVSVLPYMKLWKLERRSRGTGGADVRMSNDISM